MPGSIRLANNVIKALTTHNLVIMRNHGLIVAGSSFSEVLKRALFFELACEMIVKSSEELSRITIKKEIKQVT
jgi:ribulose-5-phosphate 4-epimerase/fuculose-1-phosphate aldolase